MRTIVLIAAWLCAGYSALTMFLVANAHFDWVTNSPHAVYLGGRTPGEAEAHALIGFAIALGLGVLAWFMKQYKTKKEKE